MKLKWDARSRCECMRRNAVRQEMVKKRQLLRISNPVAKKINVVYVHNQHQHLELESGAVTADMRQLWSSITVPPDEVAFERALRQKAIEPAKQDQSAYALTVCVTQ
jgi:hypothetical protein